MITEPMLAATLKTLDYPKLKFPLIATPKLNGWRCLKVNGKVLTRKFLPIPNHYIRETVEKLIPNGMDGEILCGTYNETQKACARHDGKPDFQFWAFDYVGQNRLYRSYEDRLADLYTWYDEEYGADERIKILRGRFVDDFDELFEYEAQMVEGNLHEGICLRTPDSPYKCGRSTLREQYLMKYKRFEDSEGVVVDIIEKKRNENEAKHDAFGRTKRGHAKAGRVNAGTLGALVIFDKKYKWTFELGTGWTADEADYIWRNRKRIIQEKWISKYKFNKHGMKDKPLNASWQGWRSKVDL